jgi:hypothetical protein
MPEILIAQFDYFLKIIIAKNGENDFVSIIIGGNEVLHVIPAIKPNRFGRAQYIFLPMGCPLNRYLLKIILYSLFGLIQGRMLSRPGSHRALSPAHLRGR